MTCSAILRPLKRCAATAKATTYQISSTRRPILGVSTRNAGSQTCTNSTFRTYAILRDHNPIVTASSPFLAYHQEKITTLYQSTSSQQRYLSDIKPSVEESVEEEKTSKSPIEIPVITTNFVNPNDVRNRKPSVLTQAFASLQEPPTSGKAWHYLQIYAAGGKRVRHEDFLMLCKISRPNYLKDAKVIRTALSDLKRCNRFILTTESASAAMEGMFRSLGPRLLRDGERKFTLVSPLEAGIWLGEAFVNRGTGLFLCVQTQMLEEMVLQPLLDDLSTESAKVPAINNEDNDDATEDDEGDADNTNSDEPATPTELKAVQVTKELIDTLLWRSSVPTKDMKKRAKRKYLRYRKCCEGAHPQTIHMAAQICVAAANHSNLGREHKEECLTIARSIIDEYKTKEFLGLVMAETMTLVEEAEMEAAKVLASENEVLGEADEGFVDETPKDEDKK